MDVGGKLSIDNPKVKLGAMRLASTALSAAAALTFLATPVSGGLRTASAAIDVSADKMDTSLNDAQRVRNAAGYTAKAAASFVGGGAAALMLDVVQKGVTVSKTVDAVTNGANVLGITGGETVSAASPGAPKTPKVPANPATKTPTHS